LKRIESNQASDIDDLTDDVILNLLKSPLKLGSSYIPIGTQNITRITEHTVVKGAQDIDEDVPVPSEVLALQMVREQTSIPVPRVIRVFTKGYSTWIAMEHIPGDQLSAVWPTLSFFGRLRVAFTLRRYVRQLRAICDPRSAVPGPLGKTPADVRTCQSPLFGTIIETRGPFASYPELSAFFNDRLVRAMENNGGNHNTPMETFDDSKPLVLTHQDINMRNVIVGDDGRLWLLDWAWAGFYPRWFEFVAMKRQAGNEELVTEQKEPLWDAFIPFICDPYYRQETWLNKMCTALNWV